MRIAIVGTGALGSYYGAKLCRDTHETHFLLRSDFDHVRRHGIEVCGDTEAFRVRPKCAPHARGKDHHAARPAAIRLSGTQPNWNIGAVRTSD